MKHYPTHTLTEAELQPIWEALIYRPETAEVHMSFDDLRSWLQESYRTYIFRLREQREISVSEMERVVRKKVQSLRHSAEILQHELAPNADKWGPSYRFIVISAYDSLLPPRDLWSQENSLEDDRNLAAVSYENGTSVHQDAIKLLGALADGLERYLDNAKWWRERKPSAEPPLGYTADRQLVFLLLVQIWCQARKEKSTEIRPGSREHPGPLVRFLQAATNPIRGCQHVSLEPIPWPTLRWHAEEIKKDAAQGRIQG